MVMIGLDWLLARAASFTAALNRPLYMFLRGWVLLTWSLFPTIWLLAESDRISSNTEHILYFVADTFAKVFLPSPRRPRDCLLSLIPAALQVGLTSCLQACCFNH